MTTAEGLDREALYSDETAQFRWPVGSEAGDEIILRFRTAKNNVSEVWLCTKTERIRMRMAFTRGRFDYYETTVTPGSYGFSYIYEIVRMEERVFYDRTGVSEKDMSENPERAFRVIPGFRVPDWARGAVLYQILVDRFRNGDPAGDVLSGEYSYLHRPSEQVTDWFSRPQEPDVFRFYGGDLQGVMEKLDYLKWLGVEAIYFNPLFVSPSNHKYDIQDYDHIDPHFTGFPEDGGALLPPGSEDNREAERYRRRVTSMKNLEHANEYFAELIREAHKRGIRVIMDGVFNHCGSANRWMDADRIYSGQDGFPNGAFVDPDSPYHDYFIFRENSRWPEKVHYAGWWGHETLPKLYYENSPELRREILRIAKKWVSAPYNADGWRLDVAADVGLSDSFNHEFWQDFRAAVKEANPEAVIIAEHYGRPSEWLKGGEWDTVMNYDAFMEPVSFFLTGMEKHSDRQSAWLEGDGQRFFETLSQKMCDMPEQSVYTAMNELSNHDHSRFLTRTNRRVGRLKTVGSHAADEGISLGIMREAVVMQFTLPGAPTIYYGDEAGLTGWTDPDSRRTYPWGRENWELIAFHRDMAGIHKKYTALRTGAFRPLCAEHGFIAYARFDDRSAAVTAVNHSDHPAEKTIPVWIADVPENGTMLRIMQTSERGYNVGVKKLEVREGQLQVSLPPRSASVFVCTLK